MAHSGKVGYADTNQSPESQILLSLFLESFSPQTMRHKQYIHCWILTTQFYYFKALIRNDDDDDEMSNFI